MKAIRKGIIFPGGIEKQVAGLSGYVAANRLSFDFRIGNKITDPLLSPVGFKSVLFE